MVLTESPSKKKKNKIKNLDYVSTDFTLLYKKLFSFLHFSFHRYYLASLLAVCMHAHTHTIFQSMISTWKIHSTCKHSCAGSPES